jgi:RimJ/RimL family protein N-acetyltransferase
VLRTERLVLEPWDEARLEEFVALCADQDVMRFIGPGATWERARAEEAFARALERWREYGFGRRSLIEDASGAWLGFVEINPVGPGVAGVGADEIEIGWWLARSAWGRGFATEGALAIRDEGFERAGLERIVGRFQPANAASGRIMEKLGMRYERDATGRHDEVLSIYGLDRSAWLQARKIA